MGVARHPPALPLLAEGTHFQKPDFETRLALYRRSSGGQADAAGVRRRHAAGQPAPAGADLAADDGASVPRQQGEASVSVTVTAKEVAKAT